MTPRWCGNTLVGYFRDFRPIFDLFRNCQRFIVKNAYSNYSVENVFIIQKNKVAFFKKMSFVFFATACYAKNKLKKGLGRTEPHPG